MHGIGKYLLPAQSFDHPRPGPTPPTTTLTLPFTHPPTKPPLQLEQMQNGGNAGVVVYLPAGRYKITQTIEIKQSNVVIRGAGVSVRLGAGGWWGWCGGDKCKITQTPEIKTHP